MLKTHYLNSLLEPQSLAIIGASEKEGSIGHVILRNILANGFKGKLWAVNPRHAEILGQVCVSSIDQIGSRVDLAIVTTAPRTIPLVIEQCSKAGVHHLIIVSSLAGQSGSSATLERRIRDAARNFGVRILGPKSLGVLRPSISLNATFTEIAALPGDLALVTQSGAMCAAVLDWATMNRIGVSSAVALGAAMDVDFGEILDYLVADDQTRYILLHVERVRNARKFMSALRSAARVKPVILFKSGNHGSDDLLESPSGQPELDDEVFDTAVRRAGVVRVQSISQLFHAAKALASGFHPRGNQLAIISNGTGPAAMAADCARTLGIPLPELAPDTITAMKKFLPHDWAGSVPIDLGGDATPERYLQAIRSLAQDANVDAILVVLSPIAMAQPRSVAQGVVEIVRNQRITLCCCFMGGQQITEARKILEDAGIPVFLTPDTVIELFHSISKYYQNQKLLLQTPGPSQNMERTGTNNAKPLMEALLGEHRQVLSGMETRTLLHSFGISVQPALIAHNAIEAMFGAEQIGLSVDMKVDSPNLPFKVEEGGSRLNITSIDLVRLAYQDLVDTARQKFPDLHINGVTIEPHRSRPNGRELMIRVFRDPVFGPVISFGTGGYHLEVFRDRAVSLPPLNRFLARNLIDSTRVSRTLSAFHNRPAADMEAVENMLLSVSNMICELPWIKELEINPLIADENGALATNARMVIDHTLGAGMARYAHMAIHPYPAHLCREWPMRDGTVITVRPVRPEDAALKQEFVTGLSAEARYFRFMDGTRELPPSLLARFTQVDYDREMVLLAIVHEEGRERQIGSARYTQTPDGESVEFALAIDDRWQKCGLGRRLMGAIMDCAREKSYRSMVGDVLSDNEKMLRLMTSLGFSVLPHPEGPSMKRVVKPLQE
ncbi:MAG TPA: bifunctional acetate--CoA ligase family protein/GNAT family N-acetyltransferase [Candidatus Contendobacter sp.]|nr:bifunctional acetate--CoA ligase family protein/GNAT family N-acetyltransferase [Candidatus Contendobacter sp.]